MTPTTLSEEEITFLQESNYIENERDADSLDQAVKAWRYLRKQKELTLEIMLKTHDKLMIHHLIKYKRGVLRYSQVWIGGKEALHWSQVPDAVDQWLHIANLTETAEFPEEWAKQSHVQYEHIHPFIDGNGRTGRMFMNWQRLQAGLPILVIKEEDKYEYYDWFKALTPPIEEDNDQTHNRS